MASLFLLIFLTFDFNLIEGALEALQVFPPELNSSSSCVVSMRHLAVEAAVVEPSVVDVPRPLLSRTAPGYNPDGSVCEATQLENDEDVAKNGTKRANATVQVVFQKRLKAPAGSIHL